MVSWEGGGERTVGVCEDNNFYNIYLTHLCKYLICYLLLVCSSRKLHTLPQVFWFESPHPSGNSSLKPHTFLLKFWLLRPFTPLEFSMGWVWIFPGPDAQCIFSLYLCNTIYVNWNVNKIVVATVRLIGNKQNILFILP